MKTVLIFAGKPFSTMRTVDIETTRRFLPGKQGLWPGRRWRGVKADLTVPPSATCKEISFLRLEDNGIEK